METCLGKVYTTCTAQGKTTLLLPPVEPAGCYYRGVSLLSLHPGRNTCGCLNMFSCMNRWKLIFGNLYTNVGTYFRRHIAAIQHYHHQGCHSVSAWLTISLLRMVCVAGRRHKEGQAGTWVSSPSLYVYSVSHDRCSIEWHCCRKSSWLSCFLPDTSRVSQALTVLVSIQ